MLIYLKCSRITSKKQYMTNAMRYRMLDMQKTCNEIRKYEPLQLPFGWMTILILTLIFIAGIVIGIFVPVIAAILYISITILWLGAMLYLFITILRIDNHIDWLETLKKEINSNIEQLRLLAKRMTKQQDIAGSQENTSWKLMKVENKLDQENEKERLKEIKNELVENKEHFKHLQEQLDEVHDFIDSIYDVIIIIDRKVSILKGEKVKMQVIYDILGWLYVFAKVSHEVHRAKAAQKAHT